MKFIYFLPIQDEAPSSSVKCVLKKDSKKSQVAKTKHSQKYDYNVTFAICIQILEGSKSYGTMDVAGPGLLQVLPSNLRTPLLVNVAMPCFAQEGANSESDHTTDTSSPDLVAPVLTTKKKVQQNIVFKVKRFSQNLWNTIFRIAFIFTVVAMMVCWICVCYSDSIYCQMCFSSMHFC